MKKWFWVIIPFLLLIIGFCCWFFVPRVIFERKFYFALPKSAKIISQSYFPYEDCLKLKVRFDSDDYQVISDGMKMFGLIKGFRAEDKDSILFRASVDYETEDFVSGHFAAEKGRRGAETRVIHILITQDKANPDQYFLYVYY